MVFPYYKSIAINIVFYDFIAFWVNVSNPESVWTSSEDYLKNMGYAEGKTLSFKGFSSCTIDPACAANRARGANEHTATTLVIKTKQGAIVDETLENGFHNGHIQSLEREVFSAVAWFLIIVRIIVNMLLKVDKI